MTLSKQLWLKSKKAAFFSYYSPFVISLASGFLDVEVFKHYIAQDFFFLQAFAHAYEIAASCVKDDEDKRVLLGLKEAVIEELKMHSSVVEDWGINIDKGAKPNPATLKYTDFLLVTAKGTIDGSVFLDRRTTPFEKMKIAAYTVGSMVPCMRLYAFLGKEIQMFLNPVGSSHPYKTWIDTYSSSIFEESTLQIEALLDKLTIHLSGDDLEVIEKLYFHAMNLEFEFFYAQAIAQPTVVPLTRLAGQMEEQLVIFVDFDLTCTAIDSCSILVEAIVSTATNKYCQNLDMLTVTSVQDLKKSWNVLNTEYFKGYEQCLTEIVSAKGGKEGVFDYDALYKALEKLSTFEKLENARLVESGLLKDADISEIEKAGRNLKFKSGCLDFLHQIVNKKKKLNVDTHVVSLCWCGDLIRAAFSSAGLRDLSIYSNDLHYKDSISSGDIIRKVESPVDKAVTFNRTIKDSSNRCNKRISIYIGDSLGDLLCLLEADIGIVIGSNGNLRRVAEHFGVTFQPLLAGLVEKQRRLAHGGSPIWSGLSGILYTVSGWEDIYAFILGP